MPTFNVEYLGSNPYRTAVGVPSSVEADSVSGAILAYNDGDAASVVRDERYLVSLEPVVVEIETSSFSYRTVVPS